MKSIDYHGESVEFAIRQPVTHVTDEGEMVRGTVKAVEGDTLFIAFEDGEEGWELAQTCFLD